MTIQTSAYSGATLLGRLLGTHPAISTIGEMNGLVAHNDPDVYLCSCGRRIKECEFWKQVTAGMHARGFEFDVVNFGMAFPVDGPLPFKYLQVVTFRSRVLNYLRDRVLQIRPGERQRMEAMVARNRAFIDTVLEMTGKRIFVDTSKDRLRFRALRQYAGFDVRAIHLVRDVRGVVASRLRRGRAPGGTRQAARDWRRIHERTETALETLRADRRTWLRYEDLCLDVPGTLARLDRFLGVAFHREPTDLGRTPHHILGNSMRLSNLTDIRDIRIDERWRGMLTRAELDEIERSAGPLARRYGYH